MGSPTAFIVSDLHLGSDHFFHAEFLSWLDELPAKVPLILNGDIVDDPRVPLGPTHQQVLDQLVAESLSRPLVWVYGNHDAGIVLADTGKIQFAHHWEIDRRLLIAHGDDFDELMPKHGLFKVLFKALHELRSLVGFQRVHVAQYAKKWSFLYRVLNDHVAANALAAAKERGFQAITCGHTHAAMERERGGHRYINTGAWTERPLHFIELTNEGMHLRPYGVQP